MTEIAQIILIPKPGKNHMDVSSYRPISLLPIIAKHLQNLHTEEFTKDLTDPD